MAARDALAGFFIALSCLITSVTAQSAKQPVDHDSTLDSNPSDAGLIAIVGRDSSRVQFLAEKNVTIVDVHSRVGIDRATIKRSTGHWPKTVRVRLHLRGLESFVASNAAVSVNWSVSNTGNHETHVSLKSKTNESVIGKKNPYYTNVTRTGTKGKIPLSDGYFEVLLPSKLFDRNPESISLRWIDFYRN